MGSKEPGHTARLMLRTYRIRGPGYHDWMSASNIPFTVAGGVVLVTGAATGMGRLYALRAAQAGSR